MPAWELNQIPGYGQGNVARTMLDQQRADQQRAQQLRHNQLPQHGNDRRPHYYQPTVVYMLPPYRYFPESIPTTTQFVATPPPPTAPVAAEPAPPPPPMGALRLEVEPKEALQIYVDGVYLGTPADLGDELELTTGTRRIELRARGYRSLTFSAEIVDGRSITYRGSLDQAEPPRPSAPRTVGPPAPVAPVAPAGRTMIFLIPGCYMGNVSPKNVTLPPGCDLSKLTTISP